MRPRLLIVSVFIALGLAMAAYAFIGESPDAARERYLKEGRDYASQGKMSEALIMFKNAVKADPASAEARYATGIALIQKRDLRAAFTELRRAVDLNPKLLAARYQLGILYALSRDIPNAKEQLERIREQDPSSGAARYLTATVALAEKDFDTALKELQELLTGAQEQNSPARARIHAEIGQVHATRRDLRSAETAYRKALDIQPGYLPARVALTSVYVAMGKEEKAQEELLAATKADPENEQLLHVLGNFYSHTRQFGEYETLYRDLLEKNPESLIARKRLTEILFAKGEGKEAKAQIDEILKSDPNDTDGRYFRGRVHLAERNYSKANDELTFVTRRQPAFSPGFYYLALAQIGLNEGGQARASLLKSTELTPLWLPPRVTLAQLYLTTGDHELAWKESDRILQAAPKNRTALLVGGAAQLRQGHPEKALALFQKAQALDPKDAASHINIGAVYAMQKKYGLALREYEEALKLDPDRIDALNSIAGIQALQGNRQLAFERVEQHLVKTNRKAEVYQILGQLSLNAKDYSAGIAHFEKATQLNPDLLSAYFLIGHAYVAQQKFDQAIEQYKTVSQKQPAAIQPYMFLGILHDLKQEPKKANEYYQKILDFNKSFAPAANNLAWNYAEYGGNLDVALGLAQKARELNREDPHIADTLGWIYYKKKSDGFAVSLLKESSEKFQHKNPVVLYHLGMAYHQSGETALAQDTLRKALQLDKAFQGAEEARKLLAQTGSG